MKQTLGQQKIRKEAQSEVSYKKVDYGSHEPPGSLHGRCNWLEKEDYRGFAAKACTCIIT